MQKPKPTNARCFLGGISPDTHARWLKLCREAVNAISDMSPLRKIYRPGEFSDFVNDLRLTEVAVLPDLLALNERPTERGLKPGVAFWLRLTELREKCMYIVDVEAALTSRDGKRWLDHVEATHRKVTKSRKLDSEKASEMARQRIKADPGIVAKYRSRAFAADTRRVRVIWTSREYVNVPAALVAIGQEVPELAGVSESTIERITGVGRSGRPSKRAAKR